MLGAAFACCECDKKPQADSWPEAKRAGWELVEVYLCDDGSHIFLKSPSARGVGDTFLWAICPDCKLAVWGESKEVKG